jgi:hypothetical protein
LSNIRIIKSKIDAEKALKELVVRKFSSELAVIQQAAQAMSYGKAGMQGREQAVRAVLIGFAGNVEEMAS